MPLGSGEQAQPPASPAEDKIDGQPAPFTINCPEAKGVPVQNGDSFNCKVSAEPGFDAAGPGSNYKFTVVVSPPASD